MKVRKACLDDWLAVEALHQRARRKSPRLWRWEEHLTDNLFIVIEHHRIAMGALSAWPDESPVAWVRLAALDDVLNVDDWLNLVLPPILDGLRRCGAQKLAWMDYGGWVGPYLRVRGFTPLAEVMTLVKLDRALPDTSAVDARLRLASDADIPAVVAVDRAAFTPHWWHSEATMRRRTATLSHFAVAEVAGEAVGGTLKGNYAYQRPISTALPCTRLTRATVSAHCCCTTHYVPSGDTGPSGSRSTPRPKIAAPNGCIAASDLSQRET